MIIPEVNITHHDQYLKFLLKTKPTKKPTYETYDPQVQHFKGGHIEWVLKSLAHRIKFLWTER